jgi:hypothetical protein
MESNQENVQAPAAADVIDMVTDLVRYLAAAPLPEETDALLDLLRDLEDLKFATTVLKAQLAIAYETLPPAWYGKQCIPWGFLG